MSGTIVFTKEERERLSLFLQAHPHSAADVTGVDWFCIDRARDGRFIVADAGDQIMAAVSAWEKRAAS